MESKLDKILSKLIAIRTKPPGYCAGLTVADVEYLCKTVRQIFSQQPILLELSPPLTIVGDTHGQYHDLLRIFEIAKYPPHTNYLFLGDYVDRGKQSIETVCLLFAFKIKFPCNFFMLRGNHECSAINRLYGFYDECMKYFNIGVWNMFCEVFKYLPIAAIIEEKIFCIHGGLSPDLKSLDDIRSIRRPVDVPEEGLLCDLLWSDPDPLVDTWEPNGRGTSYVFGERQVESFLKTFHFDLVCRAHQAVMNGYEFTFGENKSLITLFSAPNYCYEYNNKGGIMSVDKDLLCTFIVIEPNDWDEEIDDLKRPGTPPRDSMLTSNDEQVTAFTPKNVN
ncbi:serine/threonine-protein phosphatase alpha-2 isoform [Histomonas meleagridis]|uniref:serine/threonine-protein phosphatase alpha-2 isoform n=1 Tax=Histomonas meleagridis TaxID=135588 RepID=UPI00355956EF|nr:serine/threonine-protein phosphatase alpha-2 isoform [Histomonas meleagridis]KAH0805788.1 serine/threonine-protein phosphatase alpha-2 isoform [Histomonas meleagridis]